MSVQVTGRMPPSQSKRVSSRQMLTSLLPSLDEAYERRLSKIDADSIKHAQLILARLCFTKRPLVAREVIDGLAVKLGDVSIMGVALIGVALMGVSHGRGSHGRGSH